MISRIFFGGLIMFIGFSMIYPLLFDGISLGDTVLETTTYRGKFLREEIRTYETWDVIKDIFFFIIGIPILYFGFTFLKED